MTLYTETTNTQSVIAASHLPKPFTANTSGESIAGYILLQQDNRQIVFHLKKQANLLEQNSFFIFLKHMYICCLAFVQ